METAALARIWKPFALRGCFGLAFGIGALLLPHITVSALALLFGSYAAVDGLLAITAWTRQQAFDRAWTLALEGIIGVGIGFTASLWTGIQASLLVDLIAIWSLLAGVLEITTSVRLRREIPDERLLSFAGIVSGSLGVAVLLWWATGPSAILGLLGLYALLFGVLTLLFALRSRRFTPQSDGLHDEMRPSHGAP